MFETRVQPCCAGIPDVSLDFPFAVSFAWELYMRNSSRVSGITAVAFDDYLRSHRAFCRHDVFCDTLGCQQELYMRRSCGGSWITALACVVFAFCISNSRAQHGSVFGD